MRKGLVRFELPRAETPHGDLASAWAFLLQVAGGVTAFGALVYATGAATMWIRMKKAGYPADIAVEHQPRSEMIALGVRGIGLILGIAAVIGVAVAIAYGIVRIVRSILEPKMHWLDQAIHSRWGGGVERFRFALSALAAVPGAFVSWRWFGVVLTVALGPSIFYRCAQARRVPGVRQVLAGALAVVVGAVCWQISGTERIQGVYLSPVPKVLANRLEVGKTSDLVKVPFPYFGQDGGHVYVADIHSVECAGYDCNFNFVAGDEKSIAEIDRRTVLLTYAEQEDDLYDQIDSPACTFSKRVLHWRPLGVCA